MASLCCHLLPHGLSGGCAGAAETSLESFAVAEPSRQF